MDDKSLSSRRLTLIRNLLEYCSKYPDSKDTVEGIVKWWLHDSQAGWTKTEVQQSLDWLVSKGWLTKRPSIFSEEIYGTNRDQLREIEEFLREP